MAPFFDTIKRSYEDVEIREDGIDTEQFLEATESLVTIFDLLESTAFNMVKSDMDGNIKKIRTRYLASPLKSATLQTLAKNERAEKRNTATEGMLWLFRGLSFTASALTDTVQTQKELTTTFPQAYEATLSKHHLWVARPAFKLAMKAAPYRADFYNKIWDNQTPDDARMQKWLDALWNIVRIMKKEYDVNKYGEITLPKEQQ